MGEVAGEGFRLSPQQRRLASTGGLDGRVTATMTVTGDVDPAAMHCGVRALAERHEALRTRIVSLDGGSLPLQVVDDASIGGAGLHAVADGDAWRVEIDVPALCLDVASCDVLLSEFAEAYEGIADRSAPLQYPDVAEWLHQELEAADERGRAHWRSRHPAPAATPSRAVGHPTAVRRSAEAGRLRRLADSAGVLPEAVVLAAWIEALRSTDTANTELAVVGVVRDGRRFDELITVVGPVEATTWVRTCADRDLPAIDECRIWTDELREAVDHVESLPAVTAALDVGFRWLPERRAVEVGRTRFTLDAIQPFDEPFTRLLTARPDGDDIVLVGAALRTADPAVAVLLERLLDRVARLLASLLDDPSIPLSRRPVLTAQEADDAVRSINPGIDTSDPAAASTSVVARILGHAAEDPAAVAVVSGADTLTYGELDRRSARVAAALVDRGIVPEEVVAVVGDLSIGWFVAVVGIWRSGGACLALDSTVPAARARAQAALVRVRTGLLLDVTAGPDAIDSGGAATIAVGPLGEVETTVATAAARALPHPMQTAFVTFTSGTTGRPKGVAVEHRNLAAYAMAMNGVLNVSAPARFTSPAAPSTDLGMTAWLVALHRGSAVVVLPGDAQLDGHRFANAMTGHAVDVLKITPSHLAALFEEVGEHVLPRKLLVCGGEPLPPGLVARLTRAAPNMRILNHYGPTEATVGAVVHTVDAGDGSAADVPIGRALPSAVAVPGGGATVPSGRRSGELWLGGASVARCYVGEPRMTADLFRPDPLGPQPGGRAYRTGDLVRLAGGELVFAGRVDDQIKIRGTRIEPGEVERELRADPATAAAFVTATGVPLDRQLEAWVVPRTGVGIDAATVLAGLRARLPAVMVPTRLHVVDALPLTGSGKPDRAALLALRGPIRASGRPPANAVEQVVAEVFADLLGVAVDDVEASFFELGGHSLLATRAIARLRDTVGIPIDVEGFFAEPTVAAVAALAGPEARVRVEVLRTVAGMSDEDVSRELDRLATE